MKRLIVILALVMGAFLMGNAQTNEYPVITYPGVNTPVVQGFDITTIAGSDTSFVASLPAKTNHAWSSDVLMTGASGDTYVYLYARAEDAEGNYFWEPYYSSPGDTLGATDSSFFFEDRMCAHPIIKLIVIPGTAGTLDWNLFPRE